MAAPKLDVPNGARSNFRIRTASVSLKVDIHPPLGLNINHVCDESSHSESELQGKEIVHFVVYKELQRAGLQIPQECQIFKSLLCTSQGFLLLRWERLCKVLHSFMIHSSLPAPLSTYIASKCHCARRLGVCNGFLCLVLNEINNQHSFPYRTSLLLYHTVSACRWALRNGDAALLDKILVDSVRAMDTICSEHDIRCQGGWKCISTRPQPNVSLNSLLYHGRHSNILPLALVLGAGAIASFILHRLWSFSAK